MWHHHLLPHKLAILQPTMPRCLGRTRMVGCSVRSRNSSSGAVRCAERDSGSSTAQICHSHSLSEDLYSLSTCDADTLSASASKSQPM